MKINITYEIDPCDDKDSMLNLVYSQEMYCNIFDALNTIRTRRKHGTKNGPVSEEEYQFLGELMDTLNSPNIGF